MDDEVIEVNHQSVAVLPYFIDDDGTVYVIGETKDENFFIEDYQEAFTFLGGNFKCGSGFKDDSPEDTYRRVIGEEFLGDSEGKDDHATILENSSIQKKNGNELKPIDALKEIGNILIDNPQHVADYLVSVDNENVVSEPIKYLSRIYLKELSKEEFVKFKGLIDSENGKLTSDNRQHHSKTVCYFIDELNENKIPFSWGYDCVLNDLISKGYINSDTGLENTTLPGSITLKDVTSEFKDVLKTKSGCPTYKEIETAGYRYKIFTNN